MVPLFSFLLNLCIIDYGMQCISGKAASLEVIAFPCNVLGAFAEICRIIRYKVIYMSLYGAKRPIRSFASEICEYVLRNYHYVWFSVVLVLHCCYLVHDYIVSCGLFGESRILGLLRDSNDLARICNNSSLTCCLSGSMLQA